MFRDVPVCFGMFHVPGFIDARLNPTNLKYTLKCMFHRNKPFVDSVSQSNLSNTDIFILLTVFNVPTKFLYIYFF